MSLSLRAIWTGLIVLLAMSVPFFFPQLGEKTFAAIEGLGCRIAEQRRFAIVVVALAAILLRLSVLSWSPVPIPEIHDEFSYLLAGDTFAHGRLTNPPHKMWVYFETFHVLQHPTYMSKFHPAQGAFLAFGEVLGHPWIGVLLSSSLMCAAILWALQGWLPARWALLGGVLAVLRFSIFGYWINSYWGGAVAALGGALVIGATPRIIRFGRARDAAILALGVGILANSRPFEGFIFCIPVAATLLLWFARPKCADRRRILQRVVFPFCAVALLCGTFEAYYNWRVTGSPILFPYTVYERTYWNLPVFIWQEPGPPVQENNPQFDAFYNHGYARNTWFEGRIRNPRQFIFRCIFNCKFFVSFFLWPELCVLLVPPFVCLTDRRMRLLLIQIGVCLGGFLLVPWFQPHYAAPLTATTFIVVTQGIRRLRKFRFRRVPTGIALSRAVVLLAVALAPFHQRYENMVPKLLRREEIAKQLNSTFGEHLVIVRYSTHHDPLEEWVHNRANIDFAKVVWAREIPGISLDPLLAYFRGRRVWLVEPDAKQPALVPYSLPGPSKESPHDVP